MIDFIDTHAQKLRYIIAGVFAVICLSLLVLFISAMGTGNTAQAAQVHASDEVQSTDTSTNIVSGGATTAALKLDQTLNAVNTRAVNGLRKVAATAAQSGKYAAKTGRLVGHGAYMGGAFAVHGTLKGVGFAGHVIGSTAMFSVHTIGKGVGAVLYVPRHVFGFAVNTTKVDTVIKPADNTQVPVISAETSAAILAHFSAQQQQEIAKLQAAQVTANHDLGGSIVAGDQHHGGYPAQWDAPVPQDSKLDNWGMYNRECVSYTAWKVYQTYGYMPYWGGVGNANQWLTDARNAGIPTSSTPKVHSVAISMHGYYGHAMWVEKIEGDMIYVSQYNYGLDGYYSEMWVNSSYFTYIYFS